MTIFAASGFKCFNTTFVSDLSMSKTTGLPYVATAKRDIIAKFLLKNYVGICLTPMIYPV